MSSFSFRVLSTTPSVETAAPALAVRLLVNHVVHAEVGAVQAIWLQSRIVIDRQEPRPLDAGRRQTESSSNATLWANVATIVPAFESSIEIELVVPCLLHPETSGSAFFHGSRDKDVFLRMTLTGTAMMAAGDHLVSQPISAEVTWWMSAEVWRAAVDRCFPEDAWIRVHRDTLDVLAHFRARHPLAGWDDLLQTLIAHAAA